jgi:hypothetical protein
LQRAGGVTLSLGSTVDGMLYLIDDSGSPQVIAEQNTQGAGEAEVLTFVESDIDQSDFASAYYRAVDPANARDTLQKFKRLHGLDQEAEDVHVIFRDSKDLGYGRDMYMRSYPNPDCGGQVIVFYVQNFSVQIVDGVAYGPVNLEGAISQDLQHHFGSNAIEFSRGLSSAGDTCSDQPFTRFFTYRSDYSSPDAEHPRLLRVDLDARGSKAMPQPCISCHGGTLRPLDRYGRLVAMHAGDPANMIGDTKSRLQAFEVDTFEFSERPGYRRVDVEDKLRRLNMAVYCSYPGSQGHPGCDAHGGGIPAQIDAGEWNGDFAREVLLGWYQNRLELSGTSYDQSFVPTGWQPEPGGAPEGADSLFRKVIGPNCFVCHGKRGNALGSNGNVGGDGKDLDFSSYQKFISHAEEIRRLVYEEGRMPLGLLNYNNFWGDPEKAELLGSFITGYTEVDFAQRHVDVEGNIVPPGRVVARAGPDRLTAVSQAITLDAQASLFADSYQWQLISAPTGADARIASSDRAVTDFITDTAGDYQLQLTASSSENGNSDQDQLTLRVDAGLVVAPRDLRFYDHVVDQLATCASECHSAGGGTRGAGAEPQVARVPVWWVDDSQQPFALPTSVSDTPSLGLYEQVRARVNLEHIEDSLILKKPAGIHHYGNERSGFDLSIPVGSAGRSSYDLLVNWIAEGAVCGGSDSQCPR